MLPPAYVSMQRIEEFLKENLFALGRMFHPTAIVLLKLWGKNVVTDNDRKFVLAVATSHDLETFVTRRGI